MINPEALARAGTFLLIDHGDYSNYCVMGLFVVEKTFVPFDVMEAYLQENPKDREDYHFEEDRFIAYLLKNGYVKELAYDRFFLAAYGSADEAEYFPPLPERDK